MAKRMTDLGYWFYGALLHESGAKLSEVKGKLARMGWAQMRTFGRESAAYAGRKIEPTLEEFPDKYMAQILRDIRDMARDME